MAEIQKKVKDIFDSDVSIIHGGKQVDNKLPV